MILRKGSYSSAYMDVEEIFQLHFFVWWIISMNVRVLCGVWFIQTWNVMYTSRGTKICKTTYNLFELRFKSINKDTTTYYLLSNSVIFSKFIFFFLKFLKKQFASLPANSKKRTWQDQTFSKLFLHVTSTNSCIINKQTKE